MAQVGGTVYAKAQRQGAPGVLESSGWTECRVLKGWERFQTLTVVSEAPQRVSASLLGFCPPPASRVKSTLSNEDVKAGLVWTPYLSFRELHAPVKGQFAIPGHALCSRPPGLAHQGLHREGLSQPCCWAERRTITPTPQASLPLPNCKISSSPVSSSLRPPSHSCLYPQLLQGQSLSSYSWHLLCRTVVYSQFPSQSHKQFFNWMGLWLEVGRRVPEGIHSKGCLGKCQEWCFQIPGSY